MKIKFADGPEISLKNAIPGDSLIKIFTVENTGTVATTYDIYLSDVVNTFVDKSDLAKPNIKYYDSCVYSASTYNNHARGKLGDATKEMLKVFGSLTGGWNGDYAKLPGGNASWFRRDGGTNDAAYANLFLFSKQKPITIF